MFRFSGLTAAILLLGLTANIPAANASWEEATKAFAKKEYAAAVKLFRPLAEKGNALAQYQVALMHRMGLGVTKDQKEAKKWSRLAAKQGNADAQLMLGSLYWKADGQESPDVVRAYMWYEASAQEGNTEAKGTGFPRERDDAAATRRCARQGAKMRVVQIRTVRLTERARTVPRTQRSAQAMCCRAGAHVLRDVNVGPGAAVYRQEALHRVRDTSLSMPARENSAGCGSGSRRACRSRSSRARTSARSIRRPVPACRASTGLRRETRWRASGCGSGRD